MTGEGEGLGEQIEATPGRAPRNSEGLERNQDDDIADARIPVQSSDFELVEETQKVGWEGRIAQGEGRIAQGAVEAIGVRGHKLLEILRTQMRGPDMEDTDAGYEGFVTTVCYRKRNVLRQSS